MGARIAASEPLAKGKLVRAIERARTI